MSRTPRAWALNLEADDERARPKGWTPPRKLLDKIDEQRALLRATLLREGDVVIERDDPRVLGEGWIGVAWSPTARARAMLERARVRLEGMADERVLDFVCSRRFAQSLLPATPRERVVEAGFDPAELPAGPSRISLAHTCAGRGHAYASSREQCAAITDELLRKHTAVFVAERVTVLQDFAMHGFVGVDGALVLGEPTQQRTDPRTGAWRESAIATDLRADEAVLLARYARDAGEALARAGYVGPFGIDGFRFRDAQDREAFCGRCELNARYTMGWAIGMRALRDACESMGRTV